VGERDGEEENVESNRLKSKGNSAGELGGNIGRGGEGGICCLSEEKRMGQMGGRGVNVRGEKHSECASERVEGGEE
jgi:hypothetical protein